MLGFLSKKKLSEGLVASMFVNSIVEMVDRGFLEIAGLINEDSTFKAPPTLTEKDSDQFLMIIIAGNLLMLPEFFASPQDKRISNLVIEKFAKVFEMEPDKLLSMVLYYQDFMLQINEPSTNKLHAITKTLFYKFELNDFQEAHFQKMNSPSPVFLLRMSDVLSNFVWSWENFFTKFRLTA